ncbi:MAG: hypothetical protein WBQ05_13915 [Candidatus Competibacter denitrificans]
MESGGCKRCGSEASVKSGRVRGLQRYRCKACGYHFTATPPRGKPAAMKALALLLYAMGNVSFCSIARLLHVSDVAVLKWVRAEARKLPIPEVAGETVVVTLDEMWHFLKKKPPSFGSGVRMTLTVGEPWPGCWVAVMTPPVNSYSTASVSRANNSLPTTGPVTIA